MRFLVSGFWVGDKIPFVNYLATTEKWSEISQEDDADFADMDEEDILESMSPNAKYSFITTSYKVLG